MKIASLAVEARVFPLIEVFHGEKVKITHEPAGIDVGEYLRARGRFSYLTKSKWNW